MIESNDMKLKYVQKKGLDEIDSYMTFSLNKNADKSVTFVHVISQNEIESSSKEGSTFFCLRKKSVNWLKEVFLPQGYPHSVSSDYLQYQIWDSLQAYCSNLAGALSLHSTLVGIGVGQDTASPLAAAISWLTKDGTGMVSSITFAYYKGCELDYNSKQWRLFADIANDGAHFIKLLAPVLPVPFLVTFCISSVMSSLVGVAGGATRTTLIQHQALCNNAADVSAKDGSQETLVNLAGLLTSLTLLPLLTSTPLVTWGTFLLCVILHLYTNYRAMRTIEIKTLNRPRLLSILNSFTTRAIVPDVTSTNQNEPLFYGPAFIRDYLTPNFKLELGVSLHYVVKRFSQKQEEFKSFLSTQSSTFEEHRYLIFLHRDRRTIYTVYHEKAELDHYLESIWVAYLCAMNLEPNKRGQLCESYRISDTENTNQFVESVQKCGQFLIEFREKLLVKEWQLSPLRIQIGEWRLVQSET